MKINTPYNRNETFYETEEICVPPSISVCKSFLLSSTPIFFVTKLMILCVSFYSVSSNNNFWLFQLHRTSHTLYYFLKY